jgi:hypothetical protein
MRIQTLNIEYRGYHLAYAVGRHGYLAAWKSSLCDEWYIGHIYVDTVSEIRKLAEECIDFEYKRQSLEAGLGRKLTMNEMLELGKKLRNN